MLNIELYQTTIYVYRPPQIADVPRRTGIEVDVIIHKSMTCSNNNVSGGEVSAEVGGARLSKVVERTTERLEGDEWKVCAHCLRPSTSQLFSCEIAIHHCTTNSLRSYRPSPLLL